MRKLLTVVCLVFVCYHLDAQTWFPIGPDDENQANFHSAGTCFAIGQNDAVYSLGRGNLINNTHGVQVRKFENGIWEDIGTPGFTTISSYSWSSALHQAIAIDNNNTPYLATLRNNQTVTVWKFANGTWDVVGNGDFISCLVYGNIDLAIDPFGVPHLLSTTPTDNPSDPFSAYGGVVMKYDALQTEWDTLGDFGFALGSCGNGSIEFDNSGVPYIAYRDGGNGNATTVRKLVGNTWMIVGEVEASGSSSAAGLALAFAPDNMPWVVIEDDSNADKVSVKKYDGSNWIYVGQQGFSQNAIVSADLGFDNAGTPFVIFNKQGPGNDVEIRRLAAGGTSWQTVGNSPSIGASNNINVSMLFKSNGTPVVGFDDTGIWVKASVMQWNELSSEWERLGTKGYSAGDADRASIAVDELDHVYTVYRDEINDDRISMMKHDGSSWEYVGQPGFSADTVEYPSMAIGLNNAPYVAYQDEGNGNKAVVQRYNGNTWEFVGANGFSTGEAFDLSIATGPTGMPFVVFGDATTYGLIVMKFDGQDWVQEGNISIPANHFPYFSDIVVNQNGKIYVAYTNYDLTNETSEVIVKEYDGTTWSEIGTTGFSQSYAEPLDIAVGPNGFPYIAFADNQQPFVFKFDGNSWGNLGQINDYASGYSINIKVDSNGKPYISYLGGDEKVVVREFDGTNWVQLLPQFSHGEIEDVSMVINSLDDPIVVYTNGGCWAHQYGNPPVGVEHSDNVSLYSIYPNPTTGDIRLDLGGIVEDITLNVLNAQGALIQTEQLNNVQTHELTLPKTCGIYFIQLMDAEGRVETLKVVRE